MISVILCLVISFIESGLAAIPPPDFNSGWLPIEAGDQTTVSSATKIVTHGLGETPVLVDVQVKATDGPNKDYIFQATGQPIRDDDFPEDYGNVMYVYDDNSVIVSAPIKNNDYGGSVIFIAASTYWQGPNQNYSSKSALFRVRAWRNATLPQPDFVSTNNTLTAASAVNSYLDIPHGLNDYPALVVCRVRFPGGTTGYTGFHADAVGAGIIMYANHTSLNSGYVVYGYDDEHFRVWTLSHQYGAVFDGTDGSGISARVLTGYLEIFAWTLFTLTPDDYSNLFSVPTELQGSQMVIEEESLTRAMAQANDGANAFYRFAGSGAMAYTTTTVASPCSYGGLVYAYNNQSARFWTPVGGNGAAICIQDVFGNGKNSQASSIIGLSMFTWKTECGNPPSISFGTVSLDDPNNSTYGSTATVICKAGYEASAENITCLTSGDWETVTCSKIDCMDYSLSQGSVSYSSGTTFGSTATITCNSGYNTSGDASVTCQANGTWSDVITCDPNDCGNVSVIPCGTITLDDPANSTYGATASVDCAAGFETTASTIHCLDSGFWENAMCTAKDCGNVSVIPYGTIALDDPTNSTYGTKASVSCSVGFETNTTTIHCLDSGLWEGASCTAKDCGMVPVIEDGTIILHDPANSTFGATANVTCNTGFETALPEISCLESGDWANATCIPKDCGNVPVILRGTISLDDSANSSYGATAFVDCSVGFETNTTKIRCLDSGFWENASCTVKNCGNVTAIPYGTIALDDPTNSTYGTTASVSCSVGFETNTTTIRCLDSGLWETASCNAKDCGMVPVTEYGTITLQDPANSTFGAMAFVACTTGFETTSPTILCLDSGVWDNATCSPKNCGNVTAIPYGTIALDDPTKSTYGTTATISCLVGFETNTTMIRCLDSGVWENASCTPKDCGMVPVIEDGTIILQDPANSTFGAKANVTCATGFETTLPTILCLDTGDWHNATCSPKDCDTVPVILRGTILLDDLANSSYGATASVDCSVGFETNTTKIRCLDTGFWENATCTVKSRVEVLHLKGYVKF